MRLLRRELGSLGGFEHYAGVLEKGMACLFARGERGSIRIGFNSSAAFNPFVPEAISRYRASHPDVQLVLNEKATSALLGDLRDRRLDVA